MSAAANDLLLRVQHAIVDPLIALLFGAAVIVFLWGVYEFVRSADSSEGRKTGGRHMLYGLIGIAVMLSAFGIINLILNTVGVPNDAQHRPAIILNQ